VPVKAMPVKARSAYSISRTMSAACANKTKQQLHSQI
jgi:hypothetical protein